MAPLLPRRHPVLGESLVVDQSYFRQPVQHFGGGILGNVAGPQGDGEFMPRTRLRRQLAQQDRPSDRLRIGVNLGR
jgi:hypothetical protein